MDSRRTDDEDAIRFQSEPMLKSSSSSVDQTTAPLDNQTTEAQESTTARQSAVAKPTSWPWTSEALALFFGIASIAAILGTLLGYQGRPEPQLPASISINAILAIFAAVLKACLAYVIYSCVGQLQWSWFSRPRPLHDLVSLQDAASGGWGSWLWLWSSRSHTSFHPLITFGALMAIITVVADPFIQQLVRPSDCETSLRDATATMPRTGYFPQLSLTPEGLEESLLPEVQDAVSAAIFTQNLESLRGECSSGNCTFPKYSTAAYCSACEDASHALRFSYSCPDNDESDNDETSIDSFCQGDAHFRNGTIRSYFPGVAGMSIISNVWDIIEHGNSDNELNFLTSEWFRDESRFYHSSYRVIVGQTPFYIDQVSPATEQPPEGCANAGEDDWRCRGYGAATCSLYPCVQTYQAKVTSGVVSEELLESTTRQDIGDTPYWNVRPITRDVSALFVLIDTNCASASDKQMLSDRGLEITQRWVSWNTTNTEFNFDSLVQDHCAFVWSQSMDFSLYSFFRDTSFMTGSVNGNWFANQEAALNFWSPQFAGPYELQRMYNRSAITFDTVQSTFANMAASLTQYIRTHGHEDYSEPAIGTEWHYAICLSVSWAWIAMPAALWAGVMVLFCYTVMATTKSRLPVWKFSPLPLLLQGPFTRDEKEDRQGDNYKESSVSSMENRARGIIVQLETVEGEIGLWQVKETGQINS